MNNTPSVPGAPAPAATGAPQNAPNPAYPVNRPGDPWQFAPPPVPRQPVPAAMADGVMALAILPLAWWFCRLCLTGWLGLGVTLFTAAFVAAVLWYRRGSGLSVPKSGMPWLGVMALSALNFTVMDNRLLAWLNLLFLMAVTAYWVAVVNGTRIRDRLGEHLPADLVNHLLVVPFQNFGCLTAVAKKALSKTRLGRELGIVLLSCLCSVPLLWYICLQLSQVDGGFSRLLEELSRLLSLENILSVTTILAVPVAFYLYGLLYGSQHRRYTATLTAEQLDQAAQKRHILPPAAAYTLLTLLCLVYTLFFLVGAAGMLSFARSVHTPWEYAGFARDGFFELCRVSVVNLLVLWGLRLFQKTSSQRPTVATRIFYSLLCCQTLLLIALALCKMGLYIRYCGATWLRVCTTWSMALMAVVFGLMLLSQFREIPLARWAAASFCLLFLVLCWMDVDRLVVKNAIWRYEVTGDPHAISYVDLSASASAGASDLYALWQRESAKEDSPVLLHLEELLEKIGYQQVWGDPTGDSMGHWNLQRSQAKQIGRLFLPSPQPEVADFPTVGEGAEG